jgi:hypothetical protein
LSDRDLVIAAARLASRAPPEFADFISALTSYTDGKRDECVSADALSLPAAQGRAQACVALRKILAECRTTAEKIEKNLNQKPRLPL